MELNRIESPQSFTTQQSEDTAVNHFDSELASAYIANSELSLEISEEFAVADQEGF
ncbi:MAG TPA: hypothetical protein VGE85_05625 [Terracidiphilus sp.]|jgi:hypothetical protein